MSKSISTRLSEEDLKEVEEIANQEHLEKSALIRKWILDKKKEYTINKVSEYYRKGLMSLAEAASSAKISLYELMDYIHTHKIYAPEEKADDIRQRLNDATTEIQKAIKS